MNNGRKGFSSPLDDDIEVHKDAYAGGVIRIQLSSGSKRTHVLGGSGQYLFILPNLSTMKGGETFTFMISGGTMAGIANWGTTLNNYVTGGYVSRIACVLSNQTKTWVATSDITRSDYVNLSYLDLYRAILKSDDAGNILYSKGVDSITDVGTGRLRVTYTWTFGGTSDYVIQATVEMTSTTYTVANDRKAKILNAGQANGTVDFVCIDSTAVTNLVKDPTAWHIEMRRY